MASGPDVEPTTAADWQPTEAGVDAVMAAVNTPVVDEGVAFVTEPDTAAARGTQLIAITVAERGTLVSAAAYVADSRPDLADAVLLVANRGGVLPDDNGTLAATVNVPRDLLLEVLRQAGINSCSMESEFAVTASDCDEFSADREKIQELRHYAD